jgi:chemotaxis protein MotA
MDPSTIVGLIVSFALVLIAIAIGPSFIIFVDVPSVMIVVGGTIGVTLVKFPLPVVINSIKVALKAFRAPKFDPAKLTRELVELARTARRDGILALESVQVDNSFLAAGLRLAVDGMDKGVIESLLGSELRFIAARHQRGQRVFEAIGEFAPAFGMVGTLIGLVQMLTNMSDPKSIGPAMAVALLTTLYGALIANAFALPLAGKLKERSDEELLIGQAILQGVTSVIDGDLPQITEQKLHVFLEPKLRAIAAEKSA